MRIHIARKLDSTRDRSCLFGSHPTTPGLLRVRHIMLDAPSGISRIVDHRLIKINDHRFPASLADLCRIECFTRTVKGLIGKRIIFARLLHPVERTHILLLQLMAGRMLIGHTTGQGRGTGKRD
ncbi:hypothetical protein D9M72_589410 [compost metagenome]